ncbi:MAG: FAD-dependent oxidoreductase [Lentisphaerae bacterium]|nr:FAD-dependent oxidoreductase [Lentisphaerota bacterium]
MNKPVEIWIDALDFNEKGGWKEDTQFVHLMGRGYLIASDEPGIHVKDATVQVNILRTDNYRICVRDRNWMRTHSPGKFTVLVNGKGNGKALGAMPSDSWVWEIAGDFMLEEGKCTISLHDLTGYFGRCASVLITTDLDYVPPREVERIHMERARIKGLDTRIKFGGDYDVIVAGGGPGGVPAAIACARMGSKTLLIQDRPILGGNGSLEVGITFDGAGNANIFARESGIAEEIRRLRDYDPEFYGDWTRALEKLVAAEKNLTVVYNNHVCSTDMDGSSIKSVTAMNIRTLSKSKYSARVFIDCTGDAWLGYFAGAKYRFGREASYQHGESLAPEIADTLTMSGCIKSGNIPFFYDAGKEVEYHAPEWVPKLPESDEDFGRVINGNGASMKWWLEAPNSYDDMWDGEETRDALLLVVLGYYDHIKNYWSKKERAKNYKLDFVSVFNGRRESRRLIGDYILTQNDCTSGRSFDDAISYSGWAIDVHHPNGIYSGKEGPLYCARHVPMIKVPYRCLYSKNIDNLLFAGRNVSATHLALGTLRVQNTIATLGQAAGTAAAMCIKHNETPRGIYERHIRELQQTLIKNDQYIPGFKNEDPGDPCLSAKVRASSYSKTEEFVKEHGIEGPLMPLNVPRGAVIRVSRQKGGIKHLYLKLHSTLSEPCTVTLYARTEGSDIDSYAKFGDVVTAQAIVPPMCEGWVKFPVDVRIDDEKFFSNCRLRVWLDKAEGISWRSKENLSFYYTAGELIDGKWKMSVYKSFYVSTEEPVEVIANCSPENVINGYSRIIDAERYEWVSDPEQELPQWIELEFQNTTDINLVSLVFDTDLTNPGTCWHAKFPGVPKCVKDYEVEVFDGSNWKKVAEVTDNFMRKRNHSFETTAVKKIRVTVHSTWGDKSARIMEVRAALEE